MSALSGGSVQRGIALDKGQTLKGDAMRRTLGQPCGVSYKHEVNTKEVGVSSNAL